jgi:endo-1,4-beta-xylanase
MSRITIAAALVLCAAAQGQSLRALAEQRGVKVGAAVNPARLSEAAYAETLAREFNQAEPENATKFGPIHPGADRYNWEPADAVVEFAIRHRMAVRGHTLVWHQQNSGWINGLTPGQLAEVIQEHIGTVVGRYAGKIYAWDVVNEAFEDNGAPRKTIWSAVNGYLEKAFRRARSADAKALLFYNDFSAEAINPKSDAVYAMVKDFRARGVPIDGVGMQMHLTLKPPPMESIERNMRRLIELGVEVQITELDVRIPASPSEEDLARQAEVYGDVAKVCLKFPKCTAIQMWGVSDKYSWIPRQFPGAGAALLFDSEYRPKAAYDAVAEALRK